MGTGRTDPTDFPISRAVAGSSAFPPVFPPLRVDQTEYPAAGVDYVTLTDGGVYDNLGVNPLFRKRNALDYLIVSDAGKPFAIDERPTEAGSVVLAAAIGILMEQVRGLQFKRLELTPSPRGEPARYGSRSTARSARNAKATPPSLPPSAPT